MLARVGIYLMHVGSGPGPEKVTRVQLWVGANFEVTSLCNSVCTLQNGGDTEDANA